MCGIAASRGAPLRARSTGSKVGDALAGGNPNNFRNDLLIMAFTERGVDVGVGGSEVESEIGMETAVTKQQQQLFQVSTAHHLATS